MNDNTVDITIYLTSTKHIEAEDELELADIPIIVGKIYSEHNEDSLLQVFKQLSKYLIVTDDKVVIRGNNPREFLIDFDMEDNIYHDSFKQRYKELKLAMFEFIATDSKGIVTNVIRTSYKDGKSDILNVSKKRSCFFKD